MINAVVGRSSGPLPASPALDLEVRCGRGRLPYCRGSALLAVLWLSAALSAIAFAVATTVRGEVERSATASDGVKSYFLARGAIDRALLYVIWRDYRNPDGTPRYWAPGTTRLHFEFPDGIADVDFLPASTKLNVNGATPEELYRLLMALGAPDPQAREVSAAIVDWRTPAPQGLSEFDPFYLTRVPSFRARHASLEEIEEILLVRGMTPELFHGGYTHDSQGQLMPRIGLRDCLSVFAPGSINANTAPAPVLAAVGLPPDVIAAIVARRRAAPFQSMQELRPFVEGLGLGGGRLTLDPGTISTLRATARLRLQNGELSDLRRTVSITVKFQPNTHDAFYHVLRWQDQGGMATGDLP